MARTDLAGIADGMPIRTLPSGLVIVRYRKHDPVPRHLTRRQIQTFRRRGDDVSTFPPEWTVERVTDLLERFLMEHGWILDPGVIRKQELRLAEPVGLDRGEGAHTIRIVSDGRNVHAYPVKDE